MATFNKQAALKAGYTEEQINQYLQKRGGQPPMQFTNTSPTPTPQPSNGVSNTPSTVGTIVGGIAGTPLGPLGRMVGAGVGSGIGQEVAQRQAGQPGDIGAFASLLGPLGMITRLKGPNAEKSSTEKAMARGTVSQLTGEAIGSLFHLLKPGVIDKGLDNLTKWLSKSNKGSIPREVIERRFYDETLPRALESSGEASEEVIKGTGEGLMRERMTARIPDVEELNFIRKQFNAVKDKGLIEFISNDLARIIREEQVKLAPLTGISISAQRLARSAPELIKKIPFIGELLNQGIGMAGSGVSSLGKTLSRYALPGILKSGTE